MDASDRLDLNDLELPDLLTFIAGEVLGQLAAQHLPGFDPVTTLMRHVWDDIRGALNTKIAIKDAEVPAGFGSLTLELKNRPNSRQQLREAIELHSTSLLEAVNDLLQTANARLRQTGHEGLVLLVDGLERLVLRALPEGATTHERLFLDRSEQLASLQAHTIYTVPISLFYSPRCTDLEQTFGEHNVPVPMIRLHEREQPSVSPDSPGMRELRDMLEARCAFAGVEFQDAFDAEETADYLCRMTGGPPATPAHVPSGGHEYARTSPHHPRGGGEGGQQLCQQPAARGAG